jgi:hypothetical protein
MALLIPSIRMDPAKPRGLSISDPVPRWKRLPIAARLLWVTGGAFTVVGTVWILFALTDETPWVRWVVFPAAAVGAVMGFVIPITIARVWRSRD